MMNGTASFGGWLKQHRKLHDWTQEDLAQRIGCSVVMILKLEAGERKPSKQLAELFAERFGIPDDERAEFIKFARIDLGDEQAESVVTPGVDSPWRTLHRHSTNLPAQRNAFIGREHEVALACSLLSRRGVRLVTFTGPPGVGKTRLSLEVARHLLGEFESGVYFVPLASVDNPDFIVSAIAQSLNLREANGCSLLGSLIEHLHDKRMLLVLDNFEQVASAAPVLGQLLSDAPWLKLMVTSRGSLNIYGEHELRVPPLDVPDLMRLPSVEQLCAYEAVAFFIESALAANAGFALTGENGSAVARICARLDGLPLAIELAAAQIKFLSPNSILDHLDKHLLSLSTGAVDLPARQQTLSGAIAWSYDLLTEKERVVFRQLGVFVGGCDYEAAGAILYGPQSAADLIIILQSLVDKGLLSYERPDQGSPRFRMLETIREYALEQLRQNEEGEAVSQRYHDYFIRLAEDAEQGIDGADRALWIARLEAEHDNLRSALQNLQQCDPEKAVRLAAPMALFWYRAGHWREGQQRLASILASSAMLEPNQYRVKMLHRAGAIAYRLDDDDLAKSLYHESLLAARKLGLEEGMAFTLLGLGALSLDTGDYTEARCYFEEGAAISRRLAHHWLISACTTNLGHIARYQGDYDSARILFEEALEMDKASGDACSIVLSLCSIGESARHQGDQFLAQNCFEEALSTSQEVNDKWGLTMARIGLGQLALDNGDYQGARSYLSQGLLLAQELGSSTNVIRCLEGLAGVLAAQGQAVAAVRLHGAVSAERENLQGILPVGELSQTARMIAEARVKLGEEAFRVAWAEGQASTLAQATTWALHEAPQALLVR